MNIIVVLHNIRSTYNVGAILRTAEGLGMDGVVYSGYTPKYNDNSLLPHLREKLNRQIEKSALGAEELVAQEIVEDLAEWLDDKRAEGWTIVGLENNLAEGEMAKRWVLGEERPAGVKERIVLVLGEEVNGIPEAVRTEMDYFLEILMRGEKESFNVSVAAGITLWALKNDASMR